MVWILLLLKGRRSTRIESNGVTISEPAPDFEIQGASVHGLPGLVHLFGIESPGLTASLALANTVLDTLEQEVGVR